MAISRSRSRDNRYMVSGTYQNLSIGSTTSRSKSTGLNGTCDDVIGNFPNANGLEIIELSRNYPGLTGERINAITGVVERRFNNFPFNYSPGPFDPRAKFPALTTLGKSNYAWRILSEGNPSAPDISLPTMIAELKDLPQMMRTWYRVLMNFQKDARWIRRVVTWRENYRTGKPVPEYISKIDSKILPNFLHHLANLAEAVANGHLTWRWAIKPLIKDISLMCDFSYLVSKRFGELRKLQNGQTIRRRIRLAENYEYVNTPNQIFHSEGAIIRGTRHVAYREKVWGTVKYKLPGGQLFPYDNRELLLKARRLVYGITTHEALATAWELMPWSWFADWFLGIGTVIKATNNTLGLVHSDCCLMRSTLSETGISIDPSLSDSWPKLLSDFHESYSRKERFIVAPIIPFAPTYLPVLTGKALSILTSLAVLRENPVKYLKDLGPYTLKYRRPKS